MRGSARGSAFVLVGGAVAALAVISGCVSDDAAAPPAGIDAGSIGLDGSLPSIDSGGHDATTSDAGTNDAAPGDDAGSDAGTNDAAIDAADAAPPLVVLDASATSVAAESDDTLTVTLNGVTATSIEIDDGATPIATLTSAPYAFKVHYSFLENGTHTYTAKATLASTQVVTSAPIAVVVNVVPNGFFVDPSKGLDTNAGDQANPFLTIQKAAQSITTDGQSIYLAAGTYDGTTQKTMSFTFAHLTNVRGLAAGVVLKAIAAGSQMFIFNAGGEARNLAIQGSTGGLQATAGTFDARNVSFDGCATAYSFLNGVVATVDETGIGTPVTNPTGSGLATVLVADNGSNVTFVGGGGSFIGVAAQYVPAIFARGHTTLTVKDLAIKSVASHALVLNDNAHVTLDNVTIDKSGLGTSSGTDRAVILMGGQNTEVPMTPSLAVNGGGITNGTGPGIALSLYGTTAETPSITLNGTHVDGNVQAGVIASGSITNAGLTVTIDATNTTFDGNAGQGIASPRAALTIHGGTISNNTSDGVQLNDPKSTNTSLTVRGATIAGNGGYGISFAALTGSTFDLGTSGSAGGITFQSVAANFSAVDLEAPIAGTAIGDTWMPSTQGADASGKYTTPTTLTTSGTNAKLGPGASLVVE